LYRIRTYGPIQGTPSFTDGRLKPLRQQGMFSTDGHNRNDYVKLLESPPTPSLSSVFNQYVKEPRRQIFYRVVF